MSDAQQWVLDKLEKQLAEHEDDGTAKENLEDRWKYAKEMEEQGLVNFEEEMSNAVSASLHYLPTVGVRTRAVLCSSNPGSEKGRNGMGCVH